MHYYLAPWRWVDDDTGPHWEAPELEHNAGLVDLRSRPQSQRRGGVPEGFGLFVYRQQVTIPDSIYLGADDTPVRNLPQAAAALGVPSLNANTPGEVAWEMLTTHADPTGQTRCKPLRGDRAHPVQLKLAGQLVKEEPCTGAHLARTEAVFKADYARNRQMVADGTMPIEAVRKWVGYNMWALRGEMSDAVARELVPNEFHGEAVLWNKPSTTYTDDFNRTSLGTGWWAIVDNDWRISGNKLLGNNGGTFAEPSLRHDVSLSGDDHYCQIDVDAASQTFALTAPATRCTSDLQNGYYAYNRESGALRRIFKIDAGTSTLLNEIGGGTGPPNTVKLNSSAADLHTFYVDAVDVGDVTDSSVTGGLYVALGCHNGSSTTTNDNFEAADSSPDPSTADMRVTQVPIEVLSVDANPTLRVTQAPLEVLSVDQNPTLRVTQVVLEVLSIDGIPPHSMTATATVTPTLLKTVHKPLSLDVDTSGKVKIRRHITKVRNSDRDLLVRVNAMISAASDQGNRFFHVLIPPLLVTVTPTLLTTLVEFVVNEGTNLWRRLAVTIRGLTK